MVSVRSRWQGRHGAWLIDMPLRMLCLTDSLQCIATVITITWPSVSESVIRVRLGVTVFCILALPCVTLGITVKEVHKINKQDMQKICIIEVKVNARMVLLSHIFTDIHATYQLHHRCQTSIKCCFSSSTS